MEVNIKFNYEINSCISCPYHKVIKDPDPDDWFNDDDMAVVCTKLPNDEIGKYRSPAYFIGQNYKVVSSALRPPELSNFNWIPDFCPQK